MDIDALKELRAKVSNGTARTAGDTSDFTLAFPDRSEFWDQDPATRAIGAYIGYLDSAKALHEAVLPGWGWFLSPVGASVSSPTENIVDMPDKEFFRDNTPARAWLLAILDALIAEGAE